MIDTNFGTRIQIISVTPWSCVQKPLKVVCVRRKSFEILDIETNIVNQAWWEILFRVQKTRMLIDMSIVKARLKRFQLITGLSWHLDWRPYVLCSGQKSIYILLMPGDFLGDYYDKRKFKLALYSVVSWVELEHFSQIYIKNQEPMA